MPEPVLAPGEILRKAREARGESLGDVAQILKLSSHQIDALESGRFNVLPGATFVRGFLRNYARYLGVDPEPLLAEIKDRIPVPAAAPVAPIINAMPGASGPRPNRMFLISLVITAILAGLIAFGFSRGWFNFLFKPSPVLAQELPAPASGDAARGKSAPGTRKPTGELSAHEATSITPSSVLAASSTETIILPSPELVAMSTLAAISASAPASGGPEILPTATTEVGAVPVAMSAPATEVAPAAPAVKPPPTLRLSFGVNALAEVRDASGRIVFTRMGVKGRSYSARGKPPFTLKIQQARSVKLEFDGQLIDLEPHINKDGIAHLILQ